MTKINELLTELVEHIPNNLDEGTAYISRTYETIIHLCCCGCGAETVTPVNEGQWKYTLINGKLTMHPSILNRGCKAHYWIKESKVIWC